MVEAFSELSEHGGAKPELLAPHISVAANSFATALGLAATACALAVIYAITAGKIERWVYWLAGVASMGWVLVAGIWLSAPAPVRGGIYAVLLVIIWVALFSKRPRRKNPRAKSTESGGTSQ
jgi:hypothetical protein